jgi:hypothetical protein
MLGDINILVILAYRLPGVFLDGREINCDVKYGFMLQDRRREEDNNAAIHFPRTSSPVPSTSDD